LRELSLITSLRVAQANFNWPSLNPRQALYFGMIPALIHEAHLETIHVGGEHLPSAKRALAIEECVKEKMLTQDSIRCLMCKGIPYTI